MKVRRVLPEFRGIPDVTMKVSTIESDPWILYYPRNQHVPLVIYLYPNFQKKGPMVYASINTRTWDPEQLKVVSQIYAACAAWLENQMEDTT